MLFRQIKQLIRNSSKSSRHNEDGIALVLSILILVNLLMITFVVTDTVVRIGRTSRQISQSEIAYFAAETAIERAIFEIENTSNAANLGTLGLPDSGQLEITNSSWQRYIEPINSTSVTCVADNQKVTFPADPDSTEALSSSCIYAEDLIGINQNQISSTNPLKIRLKPGKSFSLNFNISVPLSLDFYPDSLSIEWKARHDGKIIILSSTGQVMTDTKGVRNLQIAPPNGFQHDPTYRIRIINENNKDVTYTITPTFGGSIPLSMLVTAKGFYLEQKERIIAVERKNWEIY